MLLRGAGPEHPARARCPPRIERLIGRLCARLEEGQTAWGAFPDLFAPDYTNLVHAGEESGNLVEVLNRLSALAEQREELRAHARIACLPGGAVESEVIVVFVMAFAVPTFTTVFDETGQAPPLLIPVLLRLELDHCPIQVKSFREITWRTSSCAVPSTK